MCDLTNDLDIRVIIVIRHDDELWRRLIFHFHHLTILLSHRRLPLDVVSRYLIVLLISSIEHESW